MKNGFTLIELLATILILSIISLISITIVTNIISNSKESLYNTQVSEIEESTKTWYLKVGMNTDETCVNLNTLIASEYIDSNKIIDPKTNKQMNGSVLIITNSNGTNTFKYQKNSCE